MQEFTADNSAIKHDDERQPVKIPRRDWYRLPTDQRDARNGRPYVLSGARTRPTFVREFCFEGDPTDEPERESGA